MNKTISSNGFAVPVYKYWNRSAAIPIRNLIIMKLLAFYILILSTVCIGNVNAQRVSLEVTNASFQQVALTIQKQTGYSFAMGKRHLDKARPVTMKITDQSLEVALKALFREQPFTYSISGKIISLVELGKMTEIDKPVSLPPANEKQLQEVIQGRVTDSLGNPLPRVTVHVTGTSVMTMTDNGGRYQLENITSGAELKFSSVGYTDVKSIVQGNQVDVVLTMRNSYIENISIDRGYYTVSKELNTGSVSTVKGEVLHRQPVGDPLMALHGQVPGLYIAQARGEPGAVSTVRIRGRNSIANGNNPLYIVDGVPFISETLSMSSAGITQSPLATISIDNIESIEVLKDADATAIYGSRGANGVILITTKKGIAGRTQVSANFSEGFGKITERYNLLGLDEYLQMRREAFENDNATPQSWDYDINGEWDQTRFTDWQDVFIGGTARLSNQSVSLSGGNEHTQFIISGMHRNETTVFPGDYRNRKLSFHSNIAHRSTNDRFRATYTVSYLNDNNLLPPNALVQYIILSPNAPALYAETGELNWENSTWVNPMAEIYRTSTTETNNFNTALNTEYRIWNGLKLHARMGYNNIRLGTENLYPMTSYDPSWGLGGDARINENTDNEIKSWIAEPSLHYNKEFSWGKLESLVGMTFQSKNQEGVFQTASGFISDALMEDLAAATNIRINRTVHNQYRYNAVYGRIGYSYQDRYLLNLTGRRDGSSRFGPGNQFGNFGAIGLGWILSKEAFWGNVSSVTNFAKLRGSYGSTGNDQLTDYQYLSTYTSNGMPYQGVIGLNPTQLANPSFGWETVNKLEAALELGFWQDRLQLTIDWYRNRTSNQLVGYPLPGITGFPSVQANMPAVIENRGWELDTRIQVLRDSPFKWDIGANISIPKNKLVSFPNIEATTYNTQYIVGRPLSLSRVYIFTGLDPQTGVFTFEDVDGDGNLTLANDSKYEFVGQHYFGGLNQTLSYKGLNLTFDFQFVKQSRVLATSTATPGSFASSLGNVDKAFWDRWQNEGDQTYYQKYSQMFSSPTQVAFSRFLQSDVNKVDASFIRLRNLSISYDVSKRILETLKISRIRFYGQVQNLLTITRYKGIDPELTTSNLVVPPLKMVNIGVQINL